jgi:hypothetical protein
MILTVDPSGALHCLYTEAIDLSELGALTIRRASHVEPCPLGGWVADMAPSAGPMLGPFPTRSAALAAEVTWLETHLF